MSISHKYEQVCGYKIHYAEVGEHANCKHVETIVFLHGFPEYWGSWKQQLSHFSDRYRVIAPDLLGYNLSDKPTSDKAFEVPNLLAIFSQFIKQINHREPVILVAHDWGGAIAWPLVAFYPDLFKKLVILNAAHPSTFTREMINNPQQRAKSHYIHEMIGPDGPAMVEADNFAFLRSMLFEQKKGVPFTLPEQNDYLHAWSQPSAIDCMLGYYRSMPQLATESDACIKNGPTKALSDMKIPNIRINKPTLVLWGEQDKAFVPELLDGLEEYVAELTIQRFADASHWLHHEQAGAVNKAIEEFIQ